MFTHFFSDVSSAFIIFPKTPDQIFHNQVLCEQCV